MNFFQSLFSSVPALSATEAKVRLDEKEPPYLIDVRSAEEYREGRISGARLIPLPDLERRMHELPKAREIICVCRSGSRSSMAVRQLQRAGYTAINLRGGMSAWQAAGLPVKSGK